ncbi:hypothetical protein GJR96_15590 [Haloferax sp. MBLA0076]|uniref:Uncharacterized protein n=1 Tax=Haloferax litoreum TaxID=2666140 RepID=A0A6A8GJ28_9EURY|nr:MULTISPECIES: hypothetical protein [Haloferax]KAB1190403.1 hypothetical protein Hfx1148_15515 [Haloferax sp. CBA1148]MRX23374.1 hypothetical protein [Haloferax litoreum]
MTETPDEVKELRDAARELDETRTAVEERGESELQTAAEALDNVERILDQYESRATDRDDLKGYVQFREALSDTLDEIPPDVSHSESFIDANDILTTGITSTLSTSDFGRAREALEPVRKDAQLLQSWKTAREEYKTARYAVEQRHREVGERIDELEELLALGEADLDRSTDELSEPIEAYNEAVTMAFDQFVGETPAREVLDLLATAESYPLVELPTPPQRLRTYLDTADIGSEPVSRLTELAKFSRSKLDHYVADPETFSAAVGTTQTFLSQLSDAADSLTISWPPAPAQELRWRTRELVAVVGRFADEATVARARSVYRLASNSEGEFARLRATAVAREQLTDEQRAKLERGAVEAELETLRAESRQLEACLEQHGPRRV